MSIKQIGLNFEPVNLIRQTARLAALTLLVLGASFGAASAANAGSDVNARYQAERAACNNGQSNQDRATCLKEAGAAQAESRRGHLTDDQGAQGTYKQNAMIRCNALPPDERDACQRRIQGEGTTSGSIEAGGLLREVVTPDKK